ncbi:MAG: Holliday junction resolvase RuvX [Bacteroidia bacterium]
MRILAIDYGTIRTGIAVTDPGQIIATGLTTIATKEIFNFLAGYMEKEKVECIVIGEPKHMDNTPSQSAGAIERFTVQLGNKFRGMLIYKVDERLTSRMAFQTMIDGGLKKKDRQNKSTIDMVSAALILQSFMEMKKEGRLPPSVSY